MTGSRHQRSARIGARSSLVAIHVPPVFAVIRCGQKREILGDAIGRYVRTDYSRRPGEEVDAVTDMGVDIVGSANDADHDVSHIVIGAATVWKTCGIST